MKFKDTEPWKNYNSYMTDNQVAVIVDYLLDASSWEKLTLHFFMAGKENLSFEGPKLKGEGPKLKANFFSQAREIDFQELRYIVFEKKGLRYTFTHDYDYFNWSKGWFGWTLCISYNNYS